MSASPSIPVEFAQRSETFAAPDVASLRARTELTRVHVFDHALAQRADTFRTHRQLLSWMRFTTPRSSRQGDPHAIDDLSSSSRTRVRATRAAGYRAAILCIVHCALCIVQ